MKNLNGNYYVEVKYERYRIHPTANNFLRLRDEPKALRTQNQAQNETNIRKNQKFNENNNDELVFKKYPIKNQPII